MAEEQRLQPSTSVTQTEESAGARSPNVVLKLRKPKNDRKVQWEDGTVDNENMDKKKSKCCCIYEKPKLFGESSDEDSDDEGCSFHCRGHKNKDYRQHPESPDHSQGGSQDNPPPGGS